MESNDIRVAAVAGTSMGSMVATLVAAGLPSGRIADLLLELDRRVVDKGLLKGSKVMAAAKVVNDLGAIPSSVIEDEVRIVLKDAGVSGFGDLVMPLAIPAVDQLTGEIVVFTATPELFETDGNGWTTIVDESLDLARVITASASYPLAISPTTYAGHVLMDGGCRLNLPTPLFDRTLVDAVVGVGMIRHQAPLSNPSAIDVINRLLSYGSLQLDRLYAQAADIYVNLPVSGADAFQAGSGAQVIAEARQMVADHPVDWGPAKGGLMYAVARGVADAVSKMTRSRANYE
jgi:predicted acylesterase/phospholipase RssA